MSGTALCVAGAGMVLMPAPAMAQAADAHDFNIPAQPLNRALRALADVLLDHQSTSA